MPAQQVEGMLVQTKRAFTPHRHRWPFAGTRWPFHIAPLAVLSRYLQASPLQHLRASVHEGEFHKVRKVDPARIAAEITRFEERSFQRGLAPICGA